MLSEDFIYVFQKPVFLIRFVFRIFEVYLYIGITSLCLYIITEIFIFQVGTLAKVHKFILCKRQISGTLMILFPKIR